MDFNQWFSQIEKDADDTIMRMELSCILAGTRIGVLTSGATSGRSAPPVNPLKLPKRGDWHNISGEFPECVVFESTSFDKALKDYYARFGKKTIAQEVYERGELTGIQFTDNTAISVSKRFRAAKTGRTWDSGSMYYKIHATMDTGDEFVRSKTWHRGMLMQWDPLEYFEKGTRP